MGDLVMINGIKYNAIDQWAIVGDTIVYYYQGKYQLIPRKVTGVTREVANFDGYLDGDNEEVTGYAHYAYRVLEPMGEELVTPEIPQYNITDLNGKLLRMYKGTDVDRRRFPNAYNRRHRRSHWSYVRARNENGGQRKCS